MKKTLLGIAGILAMISSANAVDTSQIKAACQSSDKTLWVESNQVCIPRNPCENPNYEQYCNRVFANVQTGSDEYIEYINIYAKTHNLNCNAVPQSAKLIKDDYVVCMGNDVMVFEYDDIKETKEMSLTPKQTILCSIAGGKIGYYVWASGTPAYFLCEGVNESMCNALYSSIKGTSLDTVNPGCDSCELKTIMYTEPFNGDTLGCWIDGWGDITPNR